MIIWGFIFQMRLVDCLALRYVGRLWTSSLGFSRQLEFYIVLDASALVYGRFGHILWVYDVSVLIRCIARVSLATVRSLVMTSRCVRCVSSVA